MIIKCDRCGKQKLTARDMIAIQIHKMCQDCWQNYDPDDGDLFDEGNE